MQANLNVNVFKCDIRCAQKAAVHCVRWNCCGIPSSGKSGSSQIISCWGYLTAPVVQVGRREEKRSTPLKCSSSPCLRNEMDKEGKYSDE